MTAFLHILTWLAAFAVLAVLAAWLGHGAGRYVVRKYPSAASALWMWSVFLKIDPPPPPRIERIVEDENDESGGNESPKV